MRVCTISKGSYPIIRGGLSEWAHLLTKALKDIKLDVFCITPTADHNWKPVYEKFPSVDRVIIEPLLRTKTVGNTKIASKQISSALVKLLNNAADGEPADFKNLVWLLGMLTVIILEFAAIPFVFFDVWYCALGFLIGSFTGLLISFLPTVHLFSNYEYNMFSIFVKTQNKRGYYHEKGTGHWW